MNLDSYDYVAKCFPNETVCAWLKMDETSGLHHGGHEDGPIIMGTCQLRGGEVYDGDCVGCAGYCDRRERRCPPTMTSARAS